MEKNVQNIKKSFLNLTYDCINFSQKDKDIFTLGLIIKSR